MTPAQKKAIEYVNGDYWGADSAPPFEVRNPEQERTFLAGVAYVLEVAREKKLHKHNGAPGNCVFLSDLEDLLNAGDSNETT